MVRNCEMDLGKLTILSAPMSYFVATDVGEIVNRFSQDMTLVDFPLPIGFMMSAESMSIYRE